MRRQHGPNHYFSRSQKASVCRNIFMFCHGAELWSDSLILTGPSFLREARDHERAQKKEEIKKGKGCPSESVSSCLFISYTLAVHVFFFFLLLLMRGPQVTSVPGPSPEDTGVDVLGFHCLLLNILFSANCFSIIVLCCCHWTVFPKASKRQTVGNSMFSCIQQIGRMKEEGGFKPC